MWILYYKTLRCSANFEYLFGKKFKVFCQFKSLIRKLWLLSNFGISSRLYIYSVKEIRNKLYLITFVINYIWIKHFISSLGFYFFALIFFMSLTMFY